VKVDNQCDQPRYFAGRVPVMEAARRLQHCLQAAAHGTGIEILNCMCMTPENYLNWITSNVARASSDYVPFWKSGAKLHLIFCTYNSLWYSLFTWPDFDMFMSYDPYAWQHAVLRALSGGPVYLTDGPLGEPNADLISRLCFTDGRLPRPDTPAMPGRDVVFEDVYNGLKPLKAWSLARVEGFGDVAMIAVINVNAEGIGEEYEVKPSDVFDEEGQYVVYDWRTGKFGIYSLEERVTGKLGELDWKLFIVSPVKGGVGLIGLSRIFTSPKGVRRLRKAGDRVFMEVEDEGVYKLYSESPPTRVVGEGGTYSEEKGLTRCRTYEYEEGLLSIRVPGGERLLLLEF